MYPIALDTETFLITRNTPIPKHVCTSIAFKSESGIESELYLHGKETENLLMDLLRDPDILLVGHYIAYDMSVLLKAYPRLAPMIFGAYRQNRITDTKIRQQLFDIATGNEFADGNISGYSLAYLYQIIFDQKAPNWESKLKDNPYSWRLRYSELYNKKLKYWPHEAKCYALLDAEITLKIFLEQNKGKEYLRDEGFQAYSDFCLRLISSNGMYTDENKVIEFTESILDKQQKLVQPLFNADLLKQDKKGKITKDLKAARNRIIKACAARSIEPRYTEGGNIAVGKEAVYWSQDKLLIKRLKYSEYEKLISTYIPILFEGIEYPIYTRFDLAASGRTTSKEPGEPLIGTNFQNWPRKTNARNCIVPRDGNVFLTGDFSGAELHSMAHIQYELFGHSALGEALKNKDCHLVLAANILNENYEEVLEDYLENDSEIIKTRQFAKIGNFGFLGGMGPDTLCNNYLKENNKILPLYDAMHLRSNFMNTWTEMKAYFNYISSLLDEGRGEAYLEMYWSKRIRKVYVFTVACNTFFQALTGDGSKHALNEIVRRCYSEPSSRLYGCLPVNFVHDEIMLEIPEKQEIGKQQQKEIVLEFKTVMETKFNEVCYRSPTKVDLGMDDCWNKKAPNPFNEGKYIGL